MDMRIIKLFIMSLCICSIINAQWFDPQTLNCTVLLEKKQDSMFVPLGTGFVLWNYRNRNQPIVITAGHLLNRQDLFVSINADSSLIRYAQKNHLDTIIIDKLKWSIINGKLRAKIRLTKSPVATYLIDSTIDIGLFLIDMATSTKTFEGDSICLAKFQILPKSKFRIRSDVSLGDELYFIGFPFGIGTDFKLEPVIRSGSVAWMSKSVNEFLLDAFSFGGNSGSPVFSKILLGRNPGMLSWDDAYLLGVIVGHLGEKMEGVLVQPDPNVAGIVRNNYEGQNYGLARCIWLDSILPLIDRASTLKISE
jgi:hypothetical protein